MAKLVSCLGFLAHWLGGLPFVYAYLYFHEGVYRGIEFLNFGRNPKFLAKIKIFLIVIPCLYKLRTSCGQLEPKLLKIDQL